MTSEMELVVAADATQVHDVLEAPTHEDVDPGRRSVLQFEQRHLGDHHRIVTVGHGSDQAAGMPDELDVLAAAKPVLAAGVCVRVPVLPFSHFQEIENP
ncbi:MAG: hypothetical protein ACKO4T_02300 [Planctomycetaceae bacterium]